MINSQLIRIAPCHLQISMSNVHVVEILDCRGYLKHHVGRLYNEYTVQVPQNVARSSVTSFCESFISSLLNPIEQFASFHALHDHQQMIFLRHLVIIFIDVVDLYDMRTIVGSPMEIYFAACFIITAEHLRNRKSLKYRLDKLINGII